MEITDMNNFCRVFELPKSYPKGFCFDGGKPCVFTMVCWFNPMPTEDPNSVTWAEQLPRLKEFVRDHVYVKPGRKYILITDFGEAFVFEK